MEATKRRPKRPKYGGHERSRIERPKYGGHEMIDMMTDLSH